MFEFLFQFFSLLWEVIRQQFWNENPDYLWLFIIDLTVSCLFVAAFFAVLSCLIRNCRPIFEEEPPSRPYNSRMLLQRNRRLARSKRHVGTSRCISGSDHFNSSDIYNDYEQFKRRMMSRCSIQHHTPSVRMDRQNIPRFEEYFRNELAGNGTPFGNAKALITARNLNKPSAAPKKLYNKTVFKRNGSSPYSKKKEDDERREESTESSD